MGPQRTVVQSIDPLDMLIVSSTRNDVTPYRESYSFASNEPDGPPQGRELWDHLFSANKKWGLSTIKQDHVGGQISKTRSAYTNVTVLKSWMRGMGQAASDNHVGVLYCCAPPNVHMNGVTKMN